MNSSEDWTQLGNTEAGTFIESVASKDDPAIFNPAICEVWSKPLSFYEGYTLTRIVNKHMLPWLHLDYFSNGEDHYYLDGSDRAFQNLNARNAINLSESNVIAYLDMFISYVYEHGNSLEFSREGGEHKAAFNAETGEYEISVPLIYHDSVHQSDIRINESGSINVMTPVKDKFLFDVNPVKTIPYRHPNEQKIIEQSISILSEVQTGQEILQIKDEQDTKICVLSSPNSHGFITGNGIIYIVMPAAEDTATFFQALVLAYCLRDVKQIKDGYIRPGPDEEEEVYATINYGKNLDMIIETCKIVEEFENKNAPGAVQALNKMGLQTVYEGYKNKLSEDDLMDLYIDALLRDGLVEIEEK